MENKIHQAVSQHLTAEIRVVMTEDELVKRIPQLNSARFFDELESTNDCAKSAFKLADLSFPFIIFTSTQTKGRGRADKSWDSSDGSLTFSLGISSAECPIPTHLISVVFGLSVANVLNRRCDIPICKIKWPNDIYANGKKVSGVLIESVPANHRGIIIGCGINANNSFLKSSSPNWVATSFADEMGREIDIKELMAEIVEDFFSRVNEYLTICQDFAMIPGSVLAEYQAIDFLTDKRIVLQIGKEIIVGNYVGIRVDGAIQLEVCNEIHAFHSGSIVEIES